MLFAHSPVEAVDFTFENQRLRFFVKRDDLLHPLIGGNKWRKLQCYLSLAIQSKTTKLVSVGGAWSNHLLAVATLAKMHDYEAIGYVRGQETRASNAYEIWLRQLGMKLNYVDRELYANKTTLYQQLSTAHPDALLIPEGGAPLPQWQAAAALLDEQAIEAYSSIWISTGTGAMIGALAHGMAQKKLQMPLIGVSAIPNMQWCNQLQADLRQIYPYSSIQPALKAMRFGKLSNMQVAITKALFEKTGIAIDPVYDSRLLLNLGAALQNGTADETALWIHSGGISGWAGYRSKCHQLFSL
jgi:1-aminocyclopropane-1-carboxylate deaminase